MNYEIKPDLEKILTKLKKKDLVAFQAVMKKITEVVECGNPEHYKPLQHDMKNKKRVHILKSFVLIFSYDASSGLITFLDYDHHDNVYQKY